MAKNKKIINFDYLFCNINRPCILKWFNTLSKFKAKKELQELFRN